MAMFFRKYLSISWMVAIALIGVDAHAEMLQPPGSRVAINAPAGSELMKGMAAMSRDDGTSMMIIDLPNVLFRRVKENQIEDLKKSGVSDLKNLVLARHDDYVAYEGKATIKGIPSKIAVLAFHDDKSAATVTVIFFGEQDNRNEVLQALSSAHLRDMKETDPSFSLAYTSTLKYAGTFGGFGSVYNLEGEVSEVSPGTVDVSMMVVLIPKTVIDISDIQKYGEKIVQDQMKSGAGNFLSSEQLLVGSLNGWAFNFTTGTQMGAEDRTDKASVYVAGLAYDEGIIWFEGRAPLAEAQKWLPEFRKIVASFRLKQNKSETQK